MGAVRTACQGLAWFATSAVLVLPLLAPGGALGSGQAASGLEVSGDISGLVPGRPGVLRVTIHNPADEAQVVRNLDVAVSGGGACGPGGLSVSGWGASLTVPASGSAARDLPVTVRSDAVCVGVTWRLAYTAGG